MYWLKLGKHIHETRGWALDTVHNSRRPLHRILHFLTFNGRDIVMEYITMPNLVILVLAVLVLSCGQTDTYRE